MYSKSVSRRSVDTIGKLELTGKIKLYVISLRASYHPDITIGRIITILQEKSWPESGDLRNPKITLMYCHRFPILNQMIQSITEKMKKQS